MISVKVEGLEELQRKLHKLGAENVKVLRKAGLAAMEPVVEDMKQHSGYDTSSKEEHMRDSITARSTTKGDALVTVRAGPGKKHRIKALAQEFGTIKQVAKPFIRPALDYNKTRVLQILAITIREELKNR